MFEEGNSFNIFIFKIFLFTFLVDANFLNPCQYNVEINKPLNLDDNVDGEDFLSVCFRNLDLKELENIKVDGHKCEIHSQSLKGIYAFEAWWWYNT